MAGLLALLLISAIAVTFVAGNCDSDDSVTVISKIEGLNIDTSKVLQSISGKFEVAYATINLDSAFKTCPTSTFYKVGGEYRVNNNWVAHGEVTIKAAGDVVDTIDNGQVVRKTFPVYQSPDNSLFAFYTCNVEGKSESMGYILKKDIIIDIVSGYRQEAIARLKSVGLKDGTPVKACLRKKH